MKYFQNIRQLKFPKEFRIYPHHLPEDVISSLEQMVNSLLELQVRDLNSAPTDESSDTNNSDFFADVATGLWRLRIKMVNQDDDEPLEEMSRAFRHLESVWLALSQASIEIKDHTNEPFDPGMSVKAIAFQPTAGLNREMIIETIKPTVYNKNIKIQMGEVIVGTPED